MYLVYIKAINANRFLPKTIAVYLHDEGMAEIIGKIVD